MNSEEYLLSSDSDSDCEYIGLAERVARTSNQAATNTANGRSSSTADRQFRSNDDSLKGRSCSPSPASWDNQLVLGNPPRWTPSLTEEHPVITRPTVVKKAHREQRAITCSAESDQFLEVLVDEEIASLDGGDTFVEKLRHESVSPVVLLNRHQRLLHSSVVWRRAFRDSQQLTIDTSRIQSFAVLVVSASRLISQLASLADFVSNTRIALEQLAVDDVTSAVRRPSRTTVCVLTWNLHEACREAGVSQNAMKKRLVEFTVENRCSVHVTRCSAAAALHVCRVTKSVEQAPQRQLLEERQSFNWCTDRLFAGSTVHLITAADNQLLGLQRLWLQQLQLVPGSCLAAVRTIAAVYPSFSALRQAYKNCSDDSSREGLLANMIVERMVGPVVSSSGRIGSKLSRNVYLFVCSQDGAVVL